MVIIWVIMAAVLSICFVFGILIDGTLTLTAALIMLSSLLIVLTLIKNYTQFFLILLSSFILRMSLMFIDIFNVFSLPHSGDDTENFYKTGLLISERMYLLKEEVYGGVYSKVLGSIFYLYGDDRIFVQFLNILMMMSAMLITIEILRKLSIPLKVQWYMVILMAFFPHSLIFSSILLRESVIILLIVISIYCYILWFKDSRMAGAVLSVIFIILAASFHSAVIGILFGYIYGFIFYERKKGTFNVSLRSVIPFAVIAIFFVYILTFPEVVENWPVFNKFNQVMDTNENLYEVVTDSRGDMAYLSNLHVNNIFQVIIFAPIKVIYFIASPMPWSVRNLNDILSFALDGVFYLFVLWMMVRHFKIIRHHPLLFILMISIAAGWLIFGLGISNAGTAIRHRFKFFYIIIVFLSVFFTKKNE